MATFNFHKILYVLFILLSLLELTSTRRYGCPDGDDYDCWHNDTKIRDDICRAQGWSDYFDLDLPGFPEAGKCYCCKETSYPLLTGIVTSITNFNRKREAKLLEEHLDVDPKTFNSTQNNYNISVTLNGTDVKYIDFTNFSWRGLLTSCSVQNGIPLEQRLWENTWVNETEFWDLFRASQCDQRDLDNNSSRIRVLNSNSTYNLERNFMNLTLGDGYIDASRFYARDHFNYTIMLNITGTTANQTSKLSAENLQNLITQGGLAFVRKINDFAIMASAIGILESQFSVSTRYKSVYEPVNVIRVPEKVGIS